MKVTINGFACTVEREPNDPRMPTESTLLYHVKNELNKQGYDLIKKRMWKDGHLVDDIQQYLRTRKRGAGKEDIYVYNAHWQVKGAHESYNMDNRVELNVDKNVFNK